MKKIQILIIVSSVLVAMADPSFAKKKMVGEDLSNLIIEGENRLQVHGTVPDMPWEVDVYKDVPESLRDYALLGELKSPTITQPPLMLPARSNSQKGASPWLDDIMESPVLTLSFKLEKEIRKPQWIFLVRDSHGKPFYEIKKTGDLPEKIVWNGFGDNGKPLRVGFDYNYLMTIIDEAGNPKRFAGKPFRLNSFRYNRGGKVAMVFSLDSIFGDRSTTKFSDIGVSNLKEVKDYLRNKFRGSVDVVVYDDDVKFALNRARVIRDYLLRALEFPENQVSAQGLPLSQGEGYKHVDIISK